MKLRYSILVLLALSVQSSQALKDPVYWTGGNKTRFNTNATLDTFANEGLINRNNIKIQAKGNDLDWDEFKKSTPANGCEDFIVHSTHWGYAHPHHDVFGNRGKDSLAACFKNIDGKIAEKHKTATASANYNAALGKIKDAQALIQRSKDHLRNAQIIRNTDLKNAEKNKEDADGLIEDGTYEVEEGQRLRQRGETTRGRTMIKEGEDKIKRGKELLKTANDKIKELEEKILKLEHDAQEDKEKGDRDEAAAIKERDTNYKILEDSGEDAKRLKNVICPGWTADPNKPTPCDIYDTGQKESPR